MAGHPKVKPIKGLFCPKCGDQNIRIEKDKPHRDGRDFYRCMSCKGRTVNPLKQPPRPKTKISTKLATCHGYVITCAQNATPVHKAFLENLEAYCKDRKYKLVIIPVRYKNPTSIWSKNQEHDEWWEDRIAPYMFGGRKTLFNSYVIMADLKTQMTATRPLSGYESLSGKYSAIIGHPKLELMAVPVPQDDLPKLVTTTGCVTQRNYGDTKSGAMGNFHHTFGAIIVEQDRKFADVAHMRQIVACNDGSFIDVVTEYRNGKARPAGRCEALVMGDSHVRFIDPVVVGATWGKEGLATVLTPRRQIWHDTIDGFSFDYHHEGDPWIAIAKRQRGLQLVESEVKDTINFVIDHTPAGCESVIVASNHDAHLKRWITDTDWRLDPENAQFYLDTAAIMVRGIRMKANASEVPDPFRYWFERIVAERRETGLKDKFTVLGGGEPYMVKDIALHMHGHKGANGSKGTLKSFHRIATKTITGHGHSCGILEGAWRTGTNSFMKLDYTSSGALSSWTQTDVAILANGKRQMYHFVRGRWRR